MFGVVSIINNYACQSRTALTVSEEISVPMMLMLFCISLLRKVSFEPRISAVLFLFLSFFIMAV